MLNFFQRIIDAENLAKHGVFNPDEVIIVQESPQVSPESLVINTNGEDYELTSEKFAAAIKKLRNHYIFPEIYELPFIEYVDPKIKFRSISPVDVDLVSGPKEQQINFLPSEENYYDSETGHLFFFNNKIKCDEQLQNHFASGRKIAIKIDSDQNLVWLTTHEYDALSKWEECLSRFERKISLIDEIMKKADQIETENIRESGIFKHLPFDVVGAVKINLSGLSARSDGSGFKRNTVKHLLILENPMHEYSNADSIYRGSVLCSSQKGRHMGLGSSYDFNYAAQSIEESGITCKSCISKLKTLLKKHMPQDASL